MKTEKEIRERIEKITSAYEHVLVCGPASIQINAPRALMQVSAKEMLDTLYWVIGEERPRFTCDDRSKTDH